jgi:hypothetical protein
MPGEEKMEPDEPIINSPQLSPDNKNTSPVQAIGPSLTGPHLSIENMEVHHHPDLHHRKKHWKEYLLEFLMIFLAVSLGFFAESIRENISEHGREKQYMESMIEDLKSDTAQLTANIDFRRKRNTMIDSLIHLFSSADYKGDLNNIYYFARSISPPANFFPNDRTIQQLKSSGALRLIRNIRVSNSIMAYDQKMRLELFELSDEQYVRLEYRNIAALLFDGKVFNSMLNDDKIDKPVRNPELFKSDAALINTLIVNAQYIKKSNQVQQKRCNEMYSQASELIAMIKKEYHLEDL